MAVAAVAIYVFHGLVKEKVRPPVRTATVVPPRSTLGPNAQAGSREAN